MKRFFAICAMCLAATFASNALNAQEAKTMNAEDAKAAAAAETQLFTQFETLEVSSEDALAKSLNGGAQSKCCWFWYWRPVTYYYYPACYYYYTWYCPVYYVSLRLVSYTVDTPVTTVSSSSTSTTTTEETTTETRNEIVKTKGGRAKIAKGAVIDGKVKANSILAKRGLRSGDVITKIDGKPITSMNDVKKIKANSSISYVKGDKIKIAKKSILQKKTDAVAKDFSGFETKAVKLSDVKTAQEGTTLYDYYDKTVESVSDDAALEQTDEYGAYEY